MTFRRLSVASRLILLSLLPMTAMLSLTAGCDTPVAKAQASPAPEASSEPAEPAEDEKTTSEPPADSVETQTTAKNEARRVTEKTFSASVREITADVWVGNIQVTADPTATETTIRAIRLVKANTAEEAGKVADKAAVRFTQQGDRLTIQDLASPHEIQSVTIHSNGNGNGNGNGDSSSVVTINGQKIDIDSDNVTIINDGGKVIINGQPASTNKSGMTVVHGNTSQISLRLEIRVPADRVLKLRNGVGNIVVQGPAKQVQAASQTGDVRLTALTADEIRAEAGVGSVTVEGKSGRVEARSQTGDVHLTGSVHRDARVESGVGSVTVHLQDAPSQSLSARSQTGDVHVSVPKSVRANATLATQTGSVRSDFSLAQEKRPFSVGGRMNGAINGGGATIELEAGVGSVTLSAN